MHIHILGICGTFMGGLAAIAREAGHTVSGCDANVYPPMSDQLQALGIELVEGWGADQLALRPDLWIVGNVVTRGNPLMEAILESAQPYTSGPQWLAEQVLRTRWVLAAAGTHGKTTTSSMLAWVLEHAGLAPGFLIGGVPADFPVSGRLGGGRHFVIEADEYDTAFFDKRSKFVHYRPRTAVLANLEYDHADIFPDLAAIETQFHHLVRTLPGSGRIVRPLVDAALDRVLARGVWSGVETIAAAAAARAPLPPADWVAADAREADGSNVFMVVHRGAEVGECRLRMAGAHNRANALAVIAAAAHAGVAPAVALDALSRFAGVRRRLEVRGEAGGTTVIDDFAHHPTAIAATIAALRERIGPRRRIIAVLEPRSNTMKLGVMKAQLADCLGGADRVHCYAGGIDWDPAGPLAALGERAQVHRAIDEMVRAIVAGSRTGDTVLVMSNGGFGGVHARLLDALRARPGNAS